MYYIYLDMMKYLGLNLQKVKVDKNEILKEGQLMKKSRILKEWRTRYTIITNSHIFTFKNKFYDETVSENPTEIIKIDDISSIKSDDDPLSPVFYIILSNIVYTFKAETYNEKEEWIEFLNKIVNRTMKIKLMKRRSEIHDES